MILTSFNFLPLQIASENSCQSFGCIQFLAFNLMRSGQKVNSSWPRLTCTVLLIALGITKYSNQKKDRTIYTSILKFSDNQSDIQKLRQNGSDSTGGDEGSFIHMEGVGISQTTKISFKIKILILQIPYTIQSQSSNPLIEKKNKLNPLYPINYKQLLAKDLEPFVKAMYRPIAPELGGNTACQSVFEVLGGKHQCSNLKDELCMFYYEIVLIPEQ